MVHSRILCLQHPPLSLALTIHISFHGVNYWIFNACYHSKSTGAKYWSRLIICNNRIIKLQLHLPQTLNTAALQRRNPGWWMHSHNKIHKQSIFLCAHVQHRQGLKLIAASGFITYALPYQMSFVLPSLHLSPQMSSHVMKHMGLSWHCLQTGRAFGKRNWT